MDNCPVGKGATPKHIVLPSSDDDYYPPISDNSYEGLIFWWTFGELRSDPEQLTRYTSAW